MKMSFIYSAPNKHMFGGILVETALVVFLLYCPGVNKVFGGRPLPFFLLVPGLGFSILLLLWEEGRKKLINWDYSGDGSPNWFQRSLLW
jgi:sodium/potassium-transporting ATPase subunit alpha